MKVKNIPLAGIVVTDTVIEDSDERTFLIGNVLFPNKNIAPQEGISLYYGGKMASTTAFSCAYCQVKSEGKEIIYIPFEMKVLCPEGTLLTLDSLPVAKMMHLERIERPIADMITPLLAAFIREKGREQPEMSSIQLLARAISMNTDFISVLHRDPRFNHLSIIAYPVIENDGKKTVRATVFDLKGMADGQEIDNPLYPHAKFKLDESLLPV